MTPEKGQIFHLKRNFACMEKFASQLPVAFAGQNPFN